MTLPAGEPAVRPHEDGGQRCHDDEPDGEQRSPERDRCHDSSLSVRLSGAAWACVAMASHSPAEPVSASC